MRTTHTDRTVSLPPTRMMRMRETTTWRLTTTTTVCTADLVLGDTRLILITTGRLRLTYIFINPNTKC